MPLLLLLLQWKSAVSDKLKAQQDTQLAANERDQRVFKVWAPPVQSGTSQDPLKNIAYRPPFLVAGASTCMSAIASIFAGLVLCKY